MRITQLTLVKYKRLMLSDIQYFEYRPGAAMQLLIGSNGSGKSSVLEELTPVPAHHSAFAKGGSKTIKLIHNNRNYHLHSVYNGGSGHHSFLCDGEELNKGSTFAVQKELVEHHFQLTREIHEFLIGQTTFSSMSTAKRREWLTRMSPINLDYAFGLYNKVKSLQRDQQGVVKHLAHRLVKEQQDLPDENERKLHEQAIDRLTSQLNALFELRAQEPEGRTLTVDELQRTLTNTLNDAKQLLTQPPVIPRSLAASDAKGIQTHIAKLEQAMTSALGRLEGLVDEHAKWAQELPSRDDCLSEQQIAELKQQLHELEEKCTSKTIDASQTRFPLVDLPMDRQPRELLANTFQEWSSLVALFPDNTDERFTQAKGQAAKQQLEELTRTSQQWEARCVQLRERLARLRGCEKVHCPNCNHTFLPGVGPDELEKADSELSTASERLQETLQAIEKTKEYLDGFNDYLGLVRAFRRLVEHSDRSFQPVWDYCLEHKVMFRNPKAYRTDLIKWQQLMEDRLQLREWEAEKDVLSHRLRYVLAIDRNALSQAEQRRVVLERDIQALTDLQRQLSVEQQHYLLVLRDVETYQEHVLRTVSQLETLLEDVFRTVRVDYQNAVREETRQAQIGLAQHQEVLSRVQLRDGLLKDIEQQHGEATQAQQDFGVLVKALSPTEGLIGQRLMAFMQNIVKLINAVIAEVWTYPLEVLPSKVESDELDYKFPLNVNEGAVTPPDISRGSTSQVHIVDFAFKLLAMKFLKLDNYPLFLDEFGASFDEQHRENLIPFLNRLLETGQVQQMFFVSHYLAMHGAFNQAEVCVLDPTNITVPQQYNQHVTIK